MGQKTRHRTERSALCRHSPLSTEGGASAAWPVQLTKAQRARCWPAWSANPLPAGRAPQPIRATHRWESSPQPRAICQGRAARPGPEGRSPARSGLPTSNLEAALWPGWFLEKPVAAVRTGSLSDRSAGWSAGRSVGDSRWPPARAAAGRLLIRLAAGRRRAHTGLAVVTSHKATAQATQRGVIKSPAASRLPAAAPVTGRVTRRTFPAGSKQRTAGRQRLIQHQFDSNFASWPGHRARQGPRPARRCQPKCWGIEASRREHAHRSRL